MTARDLSEKLNYTGMIIGIRRLALKDKLASVEKLAIMSELDICELIVKEYEVVYSENEEIGLVQKDKIDLYKQLVKCISQ